MSKATRYLPELRGRAMRLVRENRDKHASEWAAIQSMPTSGRTQWLPSMRSGASWANGQ
jgi:hypothetical protein